MRLFFCLLFTLSTLGAIAQDVDSILFSNACWKRTELGRKAEALSAEMVLFGHRQSVSIVRFPARRFRLELVQNDGLRRTSELAAERGARIAINAGYWNVRKVVPATYVKVDGKILSRTETRELYRVNGIVAPRKRHGLHIFSCDTASYDSACHNFLWALGSGPMLSEHGRYHNYEHLQPKSSFYRQHPRSMIGTDRKGRIVMIVTDGRFPEAYGTSIDNLVSICRWMGIDNAINLDGGGSCTLWTEQTGILNHPVDNRRFDHQGERKVSSCILAY